MIICWILCSGHQVGKFHQMWPFFMKWVVDRTFFGGGRIPNKVVFFLQLTSRVICGFVKV